MDLQRYYMTVSVREDRKESFSCNYAVALGS
nr:MAG TPA: hypothetical protein [Caudoviricetes sp.]